MSEKVSSADNIILVGLPGTGKTLVGRVVAKSLGWDFVDTDVEIENRARKSVQRIFQEDGEVEFRLLEQQVLKEACTGRSKVVSAGGGAIVSDENREMMLGSGVVVCLDAAPEIIHDRLTKDGAEQMEARPLLSGGNPVERIKALKEVRQPYYAMAHLSVNTDNLTVEQVAREVVKAWRNVSSKMISRESSRAEIRHSGTESRRRKS